MAAHDDVVGHVHEVINLGALPNDSGTQCATVDAGIGADLHIIMDNHVAHLRHFAMLPLIEDIAITICANSGARVNADAVADLCA